MFSVPTAYCWECPENPFDLEENWDIRNQVFVAQVMKGTYAPENPIETFSYELRITAKLKGEVADNLMLYGDSSSRSLELSGEYIFFMDNKMMSLCTLVFPFSFSWAERNDIREAEYVRKVIKLSGYQP
ncbi:hypothetical protein ACG1BZ_14810 [Microbulbifer sp. CNSA002]|uniref:hypothetical protein n=1 Tax=Microbulbifer sp. CNSA002 TaxID=3373604 RepID=UPI0039B3C448